MKKILLFTLCALFLTFGISLIPLKISTFEPLSITISHVNAQGTDPAAAATPGPRTSCEGVSYWSSPFTCVFRSILVWLSMGLIWLTGWILGLASVLFNASLEYTTLQFDQRVYQNIQVAIQNVWTVFRDFSNIAVIGMFTFIALQLILGVETLSPRKMVARVLVIAVLINFSLLFTRIIINSSNFVAAQFYKAAHIGTPAVDTASAATTLGQFSTGIAGEFGRIMGVSTFANTGEALMKNAEQNNDLGFIAVALGLLTSAVFLGAAFVFLYASFLLVARAILFIILLGTSSLAFASHLWPGKVPGGYGWDQWWNSLLQNALFGPLLLILLWATLQVGRGLISKDSIGGLIDVATRSGSINALISYLVILGMLYASIRIASSFASTVAGLGAISGILGGALVSGPSMLASWGYRNTAGKDAYRRQNVLDEEIRAARSRGDVAKVLSLQDERTRISQQSRRDLNFMNTAVGATVAKTLGMQGKLAGKTAGTGYSGRVEAKVGKSADAYKSGIPSQEEINTRLKESRRTADEQKAILEERRAAAKEESREQRENLRDQREASQRQQRDAEQQRNMIRSATSEAESKHEREVRRLKEEADRAQSEHEADRSDANNRRLLQARAAHKSALDERAVVIQRAKEAAEREAGGTLNQFTEAIKNARTKVEETTTGLKVLNDSEKAAEKEHKEARTDLQKQAREKEVEELRRMQSYLSNFKGAVQSKIGSADVAAGIYEKINGSGAEKSLKARLSALEEEARKSR